jgi:hypothetical protein
VNVNCAQTAGRYRADMVRKAMVLVSVIVWMLAGASAARAQLVAGPPPPADAKDPDTARALSLLPTAGGAVALAIAVPLATGRGSTGTTGGAFVLGTLGGLGVTFGPTIGHVYAGRWWSRGLKIRLYGLATAAAGALVAFLGACWDGCRGDTTSHDVLTGAGATAFVAGAVLYVAGSIDEIASASAAARRYNRDHGLDASLTVAPIATRSGAAPGIGVVGRF